MIGVSCTAFSAQPPASVLDSIVGKFDLWEIFSEAENSIIGHLDEFADILPSYDICYSVHAPICDINIASIYDSIREASLKETIGTIEAASKLDIDRVTVHPGLSSMSVRGIEDRYIAKAKESMIELEKASAEYGVHVAIENMPEMYFFLGRTASELSAIVEGTDLDICFDIGHANTTGQIDAMIDMFGDGIFNVHIHDNKGTNDEHLTIGAGRIDFQKVLSKMEFYRGNYVIEARSLESAIESQSLLESLLS